MRDFDTTELPDAWIPQEGWPANVELSELDSFQEFGGIRVSVNSPRYAYKCEFCGNEDWSYMREQTLWPCPICRCEGETRPMKRTIQAPAIWKVWHGHQSLTTGKWVTSREQIPQQLSDLSDQATQRMGMEHRFIEVGASERAALGVTEEGMDSTHDAHVKLGYKESKGNFVFPISKTTTGETTTKDPT